MCSFCLKRYFNENLPFCTCPIGHGYGASVASLRFHTFPHRDLLMKTLDLQTNVLLETIESHHNGNMSVVSSSGFIFPI